MELNFSPKQFFCDVAKTKSQKMTFGFCTPGNYKFFENAQRMSFWKIRIKTVLFTQ